MLRGVKLSCPDHKFNSCKCDKKYSSSIKLRNKIPLLLKILVLVFTVLGICGAAGAASLGGNSSSLNLHSSTAQSGTVLIENGFSGIVTVKDPLIQKTVKLKVNYGPSRSGSGFLVTKKGHIITAFHVVSDPRSLDHKKLKKVENKDTQWYVEKTALTYYIENMNPRLGQKLLKSSGNSQNNLKLEKNRDYLTKLFIKRGWISANSSKYSIYVKGPALNGINANSSLEAHIVDVGNSRRDKDVALLKVDPKGRDLPVLNISSSNPKIGEKISIYGYPGDKKYRNSSSANINQSSTTSSSNYTPSVSSGRITEKTSNSRGITYYKSDALVAKGYSGGPVVNSRNKVTGVIIYGIQKENISKKEKRVGSLFLSPEYIKEISNKNKVPVNAV